MWKLRPLSLFITRSIAVLVLLLILGSFEGKGQVQRWQTLALEDGLPQIQVYDIAQDEGGWMWVGTHGGVSRYDGQNFRTFSQKEGLKSNHVSCILPLGPDHVFLGHEYGSTFSLIENDTVRSIADVPESYDGEANDLIQWRDGRIIAATTDGLTIFDRINGKFECSHLDTSDGLSSMVIKKLFDPGNGDLWLVHDQGVDVWEPGQGKEGKLSALGISGERSPIDLNRSRNGDLFALYSDSLICYDGPDALVQKRAKEKRKVPDEGRPTSFVTLRRGDYWIATRDNGIHRILPSRTIHYGTQEGLPNNKINCLMLSQAGNVWIGSGHGVAYSSDMAFQFINEKSGLVNESVFSIEIGVNKDLWVGTEGGLDRLHFDSHKLQNIQRTEHYGKEKLGFEFITALFMDDHDRIWVGCHEDTGRVSVLSGQNGERLRDWNLGAEENIKSIEKGPNGDIWIAGTEDGFWKCDIDPESGAISSPEPIDKEAYGIPGAIWEMHLDSQNRLWLASNEKGSGFFDGERFHPFKPEKDFPHPRPSSITEDSDSNIWFGSIGGGVIRYDGDEFDQITIEDGLTANNPFFVQADRNGSIWVGTSSGLDRIRTEDLSITSFGRSKGFTGMETNQNAKAVNEYGVLYFGTIKGVIRCAPWLIEKDSVPPELHLQRLQLSEGSNESHHRGKAFPYHKNHINFHYIGVHPDDRGTIRYRYRLKGLDNEWSPLVEKTSITFNHLPPGEYDFQVKARNSDGVWTEEPLRYPFTVTPPFWRTNWFYSSTGLLAVLLVLLIVRMRTRSLIRQQKQLEQEVASRTEELEQEKQRIQDMNEDLEEQKVLAEHQKELVETKNKEITDSLRYAKRIQKALLKEEKRVSEHLPPHFVLFKPREHVSGDFYWALEKEGYLFLTVADCTGHGVPGAFMSMLGTAFLNEICAPEGNKGPAQILGELRSKLVKELTQESDLEELKDGMDISILRISLQTREVTWAGANNPLIRVAPSQEEDSPGILRSKDGQRELLEYRADRKPIGVSDDDTPFTEYSFTPQEGEVLYIYSDGFPDQFGGERGKKYKSKNFKQLLLDVSAKPMEEELQALDEEFEHWRGDQEQIDDVCVLGIAP